MDKKEALELPRDFVNPLAALPAYVKDPDNYEKIQLALIETVRRCKKSHADPMEMSNCKTCTLGMLERSKLMQKFGFTSPALYMDWRKTHEYIRNKLRDPIAKYNTK